MIIFWAFCPFSNKATLRFSRLQKWILQTLIHHSPGWLCVFSSLSAALRSPYCQYWSNDFCFASVPRSPCGMDRDDSLDGIVDGIECLGRGGNCYNVLEQRKSVSNYTPLMRAVCADRLDLVERLIEAGANVKAMIKNYFLGDSFYGYKVNVLGLALKHCHKERKLDRTRFDIIKCLIQAGSKLDRRDNECNAILSVFGYHLSRTSTPLYIACSSYLWPVVVELLQAGCELDVDQGIGNTLMTCLNRADDLDRVIEFSADLLAVSSTDAMKSVLEKVPTLRLRYFVYDSSVMCIVIREPSPAILQLFLQSGKPIHGLEELVEVLDLTGFPGCEDDRVHCLDLPDDAQARLREVKILHGHLGSPLQDSLLQLMYKIYRPQENFSWPLTQKQFLILRMLLDAGVTMHTLDQSSQQFLYCAREWLDKQVTGHDKVDEAGVAMCYQILDQAELFLANPRRLDQLCRTQVRHYLSIAGLNVQDFSRQHAISSIVMSYLLYDDVNTDWMNWIILSQCWVLPIVISINLKRVNCPQPTELEGDIEIALYIHVLIGPVIQKLIGSREISIEF